MERSGDFTDRLYDLMRPAALHRILQYGFFFFFVYVGVRFYFHVQWAMGRMEEYVAKPNSVEAFLPISALMGLRRLVQAGEFDPVHPAGLTILLMALATAFFFRKAFCGYLCPIGCASMQLERFGKKLGIHRQLPKWLSIVLSLPKYALLIFFADLLLWGMDLQALEAFLRTPYNMVADSKMLLFFLNADATLLVILGVLLVGSLLFSGFWCRGFCPYGALLGLLSMLSPFAVRRVKENCIDCGRCTRACPSRIRVHEKNRISGPECVGCLECVSVCPGKNCLDLRLGYGAKAPKAGYWWLGLGALVVVYMLFSWAALSDNWVSRVPVEAVRALHENILHITH